MEFCSQLPHQYQQNEKSLRPLCGRLWILNSLGFKGSHGPVPPCGLVPTVPQAREAETSQDKARQEEPRRPRPSKDKASQDKARQTKQSKGKPTEIQEETSLLIIKSGGNLDFQISIYPDSWISVCMHHAVATDCNPMREIQKSGNREIQTSGVQKV